MKRLLIVLGVGLFIIIIVAFKFSIRHLPRNESSNMPKKKEENSDLFLSVPSKLEPYVDELSDEIIMSKEEIDEYNQTIATKTSAIYDIYSITKINREKIKEYINSYEIPSLPKYDDDKKIMTKDVQEILKIVKKYYEVSLSKEVIFVLFPLISIFTIVPKLNI